MLLKEGLTYEEYAREIGYLLFLKIADEQTKPPLARPPIIPHEHAWDSLTCLRGKELLSHYSRVVEALAQSPGLPGMLFRQGPSKIRNPRQLRRLIILINSAVWYREESHKKD